MSWSQAQKNDLGWSWSTYGCVWIYRTPISSQVHHFPQTIQSESPIFRAQNENPEIWRWVEIGQDFLASTVPTNRHGDGQPQKAWIRIVEIANVSTKQVLAFFCFENWRYCYNGNCSVSLFFIWKCITHLDSSCRFPLPTPPEKTGSLFKYSLSIEAWGSRHKNRTPNSCMSNGQIYDVYIYIYIHTHLVMSLSLYNMYTTKCI